MRCADLGVKIALDDFGTGYSSLSYLQRFAFDKLKIDKAFVTPLSRSANSGAMIQAIVALGNALGLSHSGRRRRDRRAARVAAARRLSRDAGLSVRCNPARARAIDAIISDAKLRGRAAARKLKFQFRPRVFTMITPSDRERATGDGLDDSAFRR